MMGSLTMGEAVVDAVFPVDGQTLPREHAQALQEVLCLRWPWLESDPVAGIHPVKVVHGSGDHALLSGRTRLLLRVQARRMDELLALDAAELNVDGHLLRLGPPRLRELRPHATLYAHKVAAADADEMAFMAEVGRELETLTIGGERVCGMSQRMAVSGALVNTFSLMLHALPAEQSLRLQQRGLGPHRLLGCGIFVPHKSAAAV